MNVSLERTEGKFAGRDEMAEQLLEAPQSADPGMVEGIGADGTSSYQVSDWPVDEDEDLPKAVSVGRAKKSQDLTELLPEIRAKREADL